MNTTHVIHLLYQVWILMFGHVHHPVYWLHCFPRNPGGQVAPHGCLVVRLAPHSVRMSW